MPWLQPSDASLLTDLYELTMAASYFSHGLNGPAAFDLYVRRLPASRNFLIACGLDDALDYLQSLRFDASALEYLASLDMFQSSFLDFLGGLRFSGDVLAVDEGEAVFADEPLLSVRAPLIEAQLVETFLLNCISFQTMVASKAARVTLACQGRPFVDFGARRVHAADAALRAPRAAFVGGASATSSVIAGREYGLPVSGTMAHSYVLAFEDEADAFRAYAEDFPDNVTLLIDTYDTARAAAKVVDLVHALGLDGARIRAVRLDSGDLVQASRQVRAILDAGGCRDVSIFASGDLDEYRIEELLAQGALVDAFGVGTALGTSSDAPSLSAVYKLAEYEGEGRRKLSPGKQTLPGRKQTYRAETDGAYAGDVIVLEDEDPPPGRPLLQPVMAAGRRLQPRRDLLELQERSRRTLASLPAPLLSLRPVSHAYQVGLSPRLSALVATEAKPPA